MIPLVGTPRFSATYRIDPEVMIRGEGNVDNRWGSVLYTREAFEAKKAELEKLPEDMTLLYGLLEDGKEGVQIQYRKYQTWIIRPPIPTAESNEKWKAGFLSFIEKVLKDANAFKRGLDIALETSDNPKLFP